ncbi:MAG: hypothetical protein KAH86_07705 [Methanosarcinales archaeon]|nr:hypothetical protein [Methanosarcinales archaeon]
MNNQIKTLYSKTLILFVLISALMLFMPISSAEVYHKEDIDISGGKIIVNMTNVYTQTHAYDYRMEISGMDGVVDIEDFGKFQQMTKYSMDKYVSEHIIVDEREMKVLLSTIDAQGILGEVNNETITIKKRIIYKAPYPLDVREHVMQIVMYPDITQYRITFPEGTKLESIDGVENVQEAEIGSRVILDVSCEEHTYLNDADPTSDHMTTIKFSKKPWYYSRITLPTLLIIQIMLGVAAVYSARTDLNKVSKEYE